MIKPHSKIDLLCLENSSSSSSDANTLNGKLFLKRLKTWLERFSYFAIDESAAAICIIVVWGACGFLLQIGG